MLSTNEANRRYFRDAYLTGTHGWETDDPDSHVVEFLARLSAIVPGGTLLDIGCGEGRHSIEAARMGFRVVGIDYEPLALKRARQFARRRGVDGIRFRSADVFHLPFGPSCFDVVVDFGCLHHQRKRDWPAYVGSVLRVLTRRGFYVLSVFSPEFRLFRGRARNWHIAQGAYRRCFTEEDISGLFCPDFDLLDIIETKGTDGGLWHVLMQRRSSA